MDLETQMENLKPEKPPGAENPAFLKGVQCYLLEKSGLRWELRMKDNVITMRYSPGTLLPPTEWQWDTTCSTQPWVTVWTHPLGSPRAA